MIDKAATSNRLAKIDADYQLVIIGGGIYGATLCWEAAHRGIKTLLVEQEDYACGASSNSLKTIHGGLRALQSFNLWAVVKGIRERSVLLRIAPNYVSTLPCILPTTQSLMKSRPIVGIGLLLYNCLVRFSLLFTGNRKASPKSRLLSRIQFLQRAPGVNPEGLTGGALWFDAQVRNTERLVWLFIQSAIRKGAIAINHSAAVRLTKENHNSKHVVLIRDQITGFEKTVTTASVIDCSAAWNFIRHCLPANKHEEKLTFLKSVNIIVKKNIFETAIGISSRSTQGKNSRLYFFSPWRNCTMIGTWYSTAETHPEKTFTLEEANTCVNEINTIFDEKLIGVDDICNVHIGYLPATASQHSCAAGLDKHLLSTYQLKHWSGQPGMDNVYSLRGTKYTLARHDAKNVIDEISKTMGWAVTGSQSNRLPVFQAATAPTHTHALPNSIVNRLLIDYGADITQIFSHIENNPKSAEVIPGTKDHIVAEIHYAISNEQALTLSDLLKRRLDTGDRAPPSNQTAEYCARVMQEILSWSDEFREIQVTELFVSYPEFLMRNPSKPN
ncbi:MAG: FAD-dependent oxidoreductase [Gammaproteobacteria bacterium]